MLIERLVVVDGRPKLCRVQVRNRWRKEWLVDIPLAKESVAIAS